MSIPRKITDEGKGDVNKKQPIVKALGESLRRYFGSSNEPSYLTIKKDTSSLDEKLDQPKES